MANSNNNKSRKKFKFNHIPLVWIVVTMGLLYLLNTVSLSVSGIPRDITYSEFYKTLNDEPQKIKSIAKIENELDGEFSDNTKFRLNIPDNDQELLSLIRKSGINFEVKPPRTFWAAMLFNLGPILLLIGFWWLMASRGEQLGNKIMTFGKVRPKVHVEGQGEKVTFGDVAGVDEAKEELQEVIEFLKDPKKFQRLGGKIPKGVLLVGPPGCGKTLIAKAVAGEAGVPFYSISGSDFVEMFVGVGASRVRDLFDQGRRAAKLSGKGAIIFIDEIDAVGRLRFSGIGGGHDEREQTLNQLLVEMDGFEGTLGLILIAATNRPDTLDPALLRPGRFDRTIIVNLPDIKGREEILKVHTRKIKLGTDVDFKAIARQTPGFSGADLANLCNEAALYAARFNKQSVENGDFDRSVERVMMGPEKKSHIMSKKEKEITALHESGHALLSLLIPEVNPLKKVSIIPRGLAGGYTFTPPLEDRHYFTKKELSGEIALMLGGRASEEINLDEVTTGAQSDLETATSMARRMVCQFGMSVKLGNITLGKREGLVFLGRDIMEERNYSEDTARIIDGEIKGIVDNAYDRARLLLKENQDKLKILAQALLEKEVLDAEEVKKLLGIEKQDESSLS
ncbi:MAG: ATP-dependent zinc metalloprotease FtsH [Candidatus Omnitrophica bacterium]|nr:ATP-dependent zinc metalloprotease FtsH [Candidatus Omnitrophota bacterium]MDD5655172.1 ATP-dependent zinc metalloprotease FtsH [Candidatus Omnitrophota bacterium]